MGKSKAIAVSKRDVIWNYVGTLASMASNIVLLPLLLVFLTGEQVGLWYVFVAISGFAQLLEFGFTSTLARNILYCLSGAKRLTKQGCDNDSVDGEVDWHLMRVVLFTSKAIYAVLGIVALVAAGSIGTVYVSSVTHGFAVEGSLPAWVIFVVSIFTNLYFLYCLTFLRGVGDVAGENRAVTIARIFQLVITATLLLLGLNLIAAAIGFLAYSTVLRFLAMREFYGHSDVKEGIASDDSEIERSEMLDVLKTVSFVAWRDGVVSLAWYGATQAMSLLCSAFLGLEETATYSVMLQFASAIHSMSSGYIRSCFPMYQSAYVRGDKGVQRHVVERGFSCYIAMYLCGTVAVTVMLPVLTLFKKDFICEPLLFIGIAAYYFLLNQHSLFCNIIVSMNQIPYFIAYIISTGAGIALSCLLCGVFHWEAWGLVIGQAVPQLLYNNWHWPKYVLDMIGAGYLESLRNGAKWWIDKATRGRVAA